MRGRSELSLSRKIMAQTSVGGWSVSRPETCTRKNSPSAVIEYSTSGSAFLALRVLDVHLRVRAVRGSFCIADVDRQAHVGQHRAERREAEHDVVRPAAVAHQADAPDLALQGPQTRADLDAELVQQAVAYFGLIHAF